MFNMWICLFSWPLQKPVYPYCIEHHCFTAGRNRTRLLNYSWKIWGCPLRYGIPIARWTVKPLLKGNGGWSCCPMLLGPTQRTIAAPALRELVPPGLTQDFPAGEGHGGRSEMAAMIPGRLGYAIFLDHGGLFLIKTAQNFWYDRTLIFRQI